jgi:antitoxin (DNA-binding transcriptional repressor) of toxin-antitoxin stability system
MQVNMHEAKTHFSQLVERALAGERVVIARDGVPLLTLEPLEDAPTPRTPGLSSGKGRIADDFDSELEESILREFE